MTGRVAALFTHPRILSRSIRPSWPSCQARSFLECEVMPFAWRGSTPRMFSLFDIASFLKVCSRSGCDRVAPPPPGLALKRGDGAWSPGIYSDLHPLLTIFCSSRVVPPLSVVNWACDVFRPTDRLPRLSVDRRHQPPPRPILDFCVSELLAASGLSVLQMIHLISLVFLFNKSGLTLQLGPACDARGLPFGLL